MGVLKVRCNIQLYQLYLTSHRLLHVELENTNKQGVDCNTAGPCASKFNDITFGLQRVLCAGMCWCQYISCSCSACIIQLCTATYEHLFSNGIKSWSWNLWQLHVLTIAYWQFLTNVSSWNSLLFMPEALAVLNTCYMSKVIVHNGQCVYPHALEQNTADNIWRRGWNHKLLNRSSQTLLPIP